MGLFRKNGEKIMDPSAFESGMDQLGMDVIRIISAQPRKLSKADLKKLEDYRDFLTRSALTELRNYQSSLGPHANGSPDDVLATEKGLQAKKIENFIRESKSLS